MALDVAVQVLDLAGLVGHVLVEELTEIAFADETDPGGILFPGCRQIVLFRETAHLTFVEIADWKQRLRQLRLPELAEKIGLIFVAVRPLEHFVAAGRLVFPNLRVMSSCELVRTRHLHRVVEKGLELDFLVAQNVWIRRPAALVFL